MNISDFFRRRNITKNIPNMPTILPAVLGDGQGNLYIPGMTNYIYAQVGGRTEAVFNNKVPPEYGLKVVVGRDSQDPEKPGVFQVLSTRTSAPGGTTGGTVGGYPPSSRYRWLGEDPLFIDLRQILPLRVGPYSGMTIQIYPDLVWIPTGFAAIPFETKDLTSYIPAGAGDAALVLVTIDDTGDVIYTIGADFVLADMTTPATMLANIPAIPADTAKVLAAVRVYNGQAEVQEGPTDVNTDIIDLRASWAGTPLAAPTATNDFLVGLQVAGVWTWVKKTLAEVKTVLGLGSAAYTASSDYATAAKSVTNGDSHNHSGGDGANLPSFLTFATYIDLNPISASDKAPYALTYKKTIEFISLEIGIVIVGAAHDSSNYYAVELRYRPTGSIGSDVSLATLNTQGFLTNFASYVLATTSFSVSSKPGPGLLYFYVTKTGTPSDIYIYSPILEVKFT